MEEVHITHEEDTEEGWQFLVEIKGDAETTQHELCLSHEDWDFFSDLYNNPRDLIIKTLYFLLERDPQDSLARTVDIHTIRNDFPEFEEAVGVPTSE